MAHFHINKMERIALKVTIFVKNDFYGTNCIKSN